MKKSIQILNGDRTSFLNLCAFPIGTPIVAMLGSDTCRIFILFDDLLHSLGATQPSRLPTLGAFFPKVFLPLQTFMLQRFFLVVMHWLGDCFKKNFFSGFAQPA